MSTTCQNVIDRAKAFSPLNSSLANDPIELVTRLQQMQQRVYSAVASLPTAILGRSRFTTTASLTSSSGSASRTASLSAVSPPMERLLRVTLANGTEVLPVSEFDPAAQLAPRYFLRGQSIDEVGNDWSATTGTVTLTLLYANGATAISPTGGTAQTISLPDEWIDLLVKPLAMYFHQKDPGRDPTEYQNLSSEYSMVWASFLGYVTNYPGELNLNAQLPPPPEAFRQSTSPG